jgi:hypothetical protein
MKNTETTETITASDSATSSTPAAVAAPHPSAALIDEWFTKQFHNMSALFDERSYTHLLNAKEDLKVSLAQSL